MPSVLSSSSSFPFKGGDLICSSPCCCCPLLFRCKGRAFAWFILELVVLSFFLVGWWASGKLCSDFLPKMLNRRSALEVQITYSVCFVDFYWLWPILGWFLWMEFGCGGVLCFTVFCPFFFFGWKNYFLLGLLIKWGIIFFSVS